MKVLLVLFSLLLIITQQKFFTQKNIWLYWDDHFESAPPFYQICYEKILTVCKKQNWTVTLVTAKTLHQYVNNYTQFQQAVKNRKLKTTQSIGDFIKLILVGDNGGVYVDVTSIFHQGLDWLQNIQNYPSRVTNYQKGQEPDAVVFYTTLTQLRTQQYIPGQGIKNFIPGNGLFFLAGKKNAPIIKLWKQSFISLFTRTFEQGQRLIMADDIYYRNIDDFYYLTIDRALSYALQKQQHKLDKNLSLFQKRKNVNEQYKVWSLHGEIGPLLFNGFHIKNFTYSYFMTVQQLKKQLDIDFFIKFSGGGGIFNQYINGLQQFKTKYDNFQQFLISQPTLQDCQKYKFFVEGSFVGDLMKQNAAAEKFNVFTINLQQRNQLAKYCYGFKDYQAEYMVNDRKSPSIRELEFAYKSVSQQTYVFRVNQNKELSLIEKVSFIVIENRFFFYLYFIIQIVFMGIFILIAIFKMLFHKLIFKRLKTSELETCQNSSTLLQIKKNLTQPDQFTKKLAGIIIILNLPNSFMLYFYVQAFGGLHKQIYILLVLTVYLVMRKFVYNNKKYQILTVCGLKMQQLHKLIKPFMYYAVTKAVVYSLENRTENIMPITIVLALIIPQILKARQKISKILQKNQKQNFILNKLSPKCPFILSASIVVIVLLIMLIPNLKFIRFQNNRRLSTKFIHTVFWYFGIVYIFVLGQYLRRFGKYYKSILRKNKKQEKAIQIQIGKTSHIYWLNLIILVMLPLFAYKCYQIHNAYFVWISNQRKILLDISMMIIFAILSLGNSQIFSQVSRASTNQNSKPNRYTEFVQVSAQTYQQSQKQQNQHNKSFENAEQIQNQLKDLHEFKKSNTQSSRNSKWNFEVTQEKCLKYRTFISVILFCLVPWMFVSLRWLYKGSQKQYDYLDFIPWEFLIVLVNYSCILVYKSYLEIYAQKQSKEQEISSNK